jgi:hypothetical protein
MLPVRRPPRVRLRPRRRHHHLRPRLRALRLPRPDADQRRPPERIRLRAHAVALVAVAVLALLTTASPALAGSGQAAPLPVTYIPPVDAPIADPFRPPAGPYGPGNRGLEYTTTPGTPVAASADGTVTFAGVVAGALHVTVLHADGVRTSYSFLAGVAVVGGQRVAQGDRVGTAGVRLHFGARLGDAYFDPATLFTGTVVEVELLPFEVPPGSTPDAEARALAHIVFAEGAGLSLPGLDDVRAWLEERARSSIHYATTLSPVGRSVSVARDITDRVLFPPPCSTGPPPARPIGGQRRVAVTVAGLGSSSTSGSIDELRVDDLGYEPGRVVRFSYAGGRTPGTGGALAGIPARHYASADTQGDLTVAAGRLADLIAQAAAADPGATVDLYAHSLGGLVSRLALRELHDRGFDLGRLGVVITLGTPHRGADAATAVAAANTRLLQNLGLDAAEEVLDTGLDPDATAIRQLAEHSDLVAGVLAGGIPPGVRLVSIAARGDLVVAAPQSAVTGATNVTVPVTGRTAHSDLVGSDAATAEIRRALAGEHPGCESAADAVADVMAGHAISAAEDHLGAALATVGG